MFVHCRIEASEKWPSVLFLGLGASSFNHTDCRRTEDHDLHQRGGRRLGMMHCVGDAGMGCVMFTFPCDEISL